MLQRDLEILLVLRILATLMVLIGHAAAFSGTLPMTQWPQFPYIQDLAVILFFCVSGYTISWVCTNSKSTGLQGFTEFTINRFLRLSIPLLPVLIFFAMLEFLLYREQGHPYTKGGLGIKDWLSNALFLNGLIPDTQAFGLNRALWTLPLEFWTYIFAASIYFSIKSTAKFSFLVSSAGILSFYLIYPRFFGGYGQGLILVWFLSFILQRSDHFSLNQRGSLRFSFPIVLMTVGAIFALFDKRYWPENGHYDAMRCLMVFFMFVGIVHLSKFIELPNKIKSINLFFGSFMYTTYLVHYPILHIFYRDLGFEKDSLVNLGCGLNSTSI